MCVFFFNIFGETVIHLPKATGFCGDIMNQGCPTQPCIAIVQQGFHLMDYPRRADLDTTVMNILWNVYNPDVSCYK